MPQLIMKNGYPLVEDGAGGWRRPTQEEAANVEISMPEPLRSKFLAGLAEQDRAQAAVASGRMMASHDSAKPVGNTEVQNRMGVTVGERIMLKNFSSRVEAKKYLAAQGYEVRSTGSDAEFNFMVRRGPGQPWRFLDPRGFGVFGSDTVLDMLDLTADTIQGSLTTMTTGVGAAAGGPVGAGVGAALGGAGTELMRQSVGVAAGVREDVNMGDAALYGVISSVFPYIGKGLAWMKNSPAVKAGISKTADAMVDLSAKIVGTDPDTLLARAAEKGYGKLGNVVETAKNIRRLLQDFHDKVYDNDIMRSQVGARQLVEDAEKVGVAVDMSTTLDRLRSFALEAVDEATVAPKTVESAVKGIGDPGIHKIAGSLVGRIDQTLALANMDEKAVPVKMAVAIKRQLQKVAQKDKVYEDVQVSDATREMLAEVQYMARMATEKSMDGTGLRDAAQGKLYSELMADTSRAIDYMKKASIHFNHGKTEPQKMTNAVRAVKRVYGETGAEYYQVLKDMDSIAGTDFAEAARRSALGYAFNPKEQGKVRLTPRFTAQGKFLGPSLFTGGAIGGAVTGNPLIALGGMGAASPLTNIAAIRGTMAASHATNEFAKAVIKLTGDRVAQTTVNTALASETNK